MVRMSLFVFLLFAALSCSDAPAVSSSVSHDEVPMPFYPSDEGSAATQGVECFLKVEEKLLARGDVELSFYFVNESEDSVVWVEGTLRLPPVIADTLFVALPAASISLQ